MVQNHRGQIKTRERVRELAEVYTHEREVKAMLDQIPDMFLGTAAGTDVRFLEPACGTGNFLEEILRRKLGHIRFSSLRSVGLYEHRLLRAVASIYGVDISSENVDETRDRLLAVVRAHYYDDANAIEPTPGFHSALRAILETNILCADFLAHAAQTEVVDYKPVRGGYFKRSWSMLDDSAAVGTQQDLFHQTPEPKRDGVPVHYRHLAANPDPSRADSVSRRGQRSA